MKKVDVIVAIADKYKPFNPIVGTMRVPKSQINDWKHGREAQFIWDFIEQKGDWNAGYLFGFSTNMENKSSLVDGLRMRHEQSYLTSSQQKQTYLQ